MSLLCVPLTNRQAGGSFPCPEAFAMRKSPEYKRKKRDSICINGMKFRIKRNQENCQRMAEKCFMSGTTSSLLMPRMFLRIARELKAANRTEFLLNLLITSTATTFHLRHRLNTSDGNFFLNTTVFVFLVRFSPTLIQSDTIKRYQACSTGKS